MDASADAGALGAPADAGALGADTLAAGVLVAVALDAAGVETAVLRPGLAPPPPPPHAAASKATIDNVPRAKDLMSNPASV